MLLRLGGAISLLFVLFHLAMVSRLGPALAGVSPDILATLSTWDVQLAAAMLIFGLLAIFRSRDLLTTHLGNLLGICIACFWFLRAVAQVIFYEVTTAGAPLIVVCLIIGLLHLVPVLREWKNVPVKSTGQVRTPQDDWSRLQDRVGQSRWPVYAAVAWCVVFGGLHLYWALGGGAAGFADFSMPSNRELALTRDPFYMGITWGVVVACAAAAIFALAPFHKWTRRIPRWMLLTPLWVIFGLFLLRGVGNLTQSALIAGGGMPFDRLSAAEAPAWNRWLLIDALFYSPWFILGGLAFGAAAWSARRHLDEIGPGARRGVVRKEARYFDG
jgi:hypothetical protein